MFRKWLSSFMKKNKNKILEVGKRLGMLGMIALLATSVISVISYKRDPQETENSISIYNPEKTMISGTEISKEEFDKDDKVVNSFIQYCNNGDMGAAYKLLSDDCKEELYPTIDDFKNKYCRNLFSDNKEYNMQSWLNENNYHTYRVRYTEDIISSGVYDEGQCGQDYITVFKVSDDEYKININGFIKKEIINKETDSNAIKVLCMSKKIYLDYEIYTIKIKNKLDTSILIDTGRDINSLLLRCENDTKYFLHRTKVTNLYSELSSDVIRKIEIQFDKPYSVSSKSRYIEFDDIVTDVEKYEESDNYSDRESIKVEL